MKNKLEIANKCFINYPDPLNFIIIFSCSQTLKRIIKSLPVSAAGQLIKHLLDICKKHYQSIGKDKKWVVYLMRGYTCRERALFLQIDN